MPVKLTSEQVKTLWVTLQKRHKVTVHDKSKSRLMKAIGKTMDLLGIMDYQTFIDDYWTTVGHDIYRPHSVVIGKGDLVEQVEKLGHEFTHVEQGITVKYLFSNTRRAVNEVEALKANMELHHYLTGVCWSPYYLANKLTAYRCTQAQIDHVRKELSRTRTMILRGKYQNPIVREIIAELEKN